MVSETSSLPHTGAHKPLIRALRGETGYPPPVWLMRQAGRYLPEYRALRQRAGSFLELCYDPVMAAEVTLQPVKRYAMDAAILFSDILVIPDALGVDVSFVEGEGPRLTPLTSAADIDALRLDRTDDHLAPVYETVARVAAGLPQDAALIGFAGPRVIKSTIKQELPPGFQRSEFLLERGQLDCIVAREDLVGMLAKLIDYGTSARPGPDPVETPGEGAQDAGEDGQGGGEQVHADAHTAAAPDSGSDAEPGLGPNAGAGPEAGQPSPEVDSEDEIPRPEQA